LSRPLGELCVELDWTLLTGDPGRAVEGAYACDMLSWAMSRAVAGGAWITILNSLNVVAVADLADVACVVLAEGVELPAPVRERAAEKGVAVASTRLDACRAVIALHGAGVV